MQIQKKFMYVDVKRFLNRDFKILSEPKSPSRRTAIKRMSLALFGFSPLIKTLGKSFSAPFEIQKTGRGVRFILDKQIAWVIDPLNFGNNAWLKFNEKDDGFFLQLMGAEFPNSGIETDFIANIKPQFGTWVMDVEFTQSGLTQRIPFIPFLKGELLLEGKINTPKKIQIGKSDYLQIPLSNFTVDHNWIMRIIPDHYVSLSLMKWVTNFKSLEFSLSCPEPNHWINPARFNNASWIAFYNPIGSLSALSNLKFNSQNIISLKEYPFLQTGLVLAKIKQNDVRVIWGSNYDQSSGRIVYNPLNNGNSLTLHRTRFVKEYVNGHEPFSLIADLGDSPQWYGAKGAAFALAGSQTSTFTLAGETDKVTYLACNALIVGNSINVSGAKSIPVKYENPACVAVLPQDPVIKRPQKVTPGQVQTTGAIEQAEPQERANWIYINQEATKLNLKIDKPILFNVIRPEDFLNLQFEFVNFRLDGNILIIDNKRGPSFLIVHFPSQHTREEAINYGQPIKFPVKFKRAGNSRLVFRVPPDHPAIPLTLASMLDWGRFDIQVNYRARWFNPGQAINQIKVSLQNISMVFNNRKSPDDNKVKGAPINFQPRNINTIKTNQTTIEKGKQSISPLEVKVKVASSPKGPGIMSLTDSDLVQILASNNIELSIVDNITGVMKNLFEMKPPSIYETSIEAPTYAEVSPNQFAGFNHLINLKDEFGEYDEGSIKRIDIEDEPSVLPGRVLPPGNRPVALPAINQRKNQLPSQTKEISGITVAIPTQRSYKNIVSNVVLKIPANLVIQQGQLFELWHSRMGIKLASGEVDENALNNLKTIRVLWSKWANEKIDRGPSTMQEEPVPNIPKPHTFHELVHLTSNYIELKEKISGKKAVPLPVKANQLMLTSLGAWFNYEYRNNTAVKDTSLAAWLLRATMGRDQFVKVVDRGCIFPFGHKAVKIEISERKIEVKDNISVAILIKKSYIVIKQPEIFYGKEQNSGFVPFPFQRVEIKDVEKMVSFKGVIDKVEEIYMINDSTKPDAFKIEVDDASGQKIRMEVPLTFVYDSIPSHHTVVAHYEKTGWGYFTSSPSHRPVSYARSLVPGDTTFETRSIMFGATRIQYLINEVNFYPEIKEASIFIKQMEELTGERKPVRIQLIDDNNLSMVFAKVVEGENASLVFGNSEKSGGLITPNMAISGLSKLTGLTGNKIDDINKLVVQVEEIFKLTDKLPKLFGIINFVDLLLPDIDLSGAINKVKNTIEEIRGQIEEVQKEVLTTLARIDSELKKLDVLLQIIGNLLDEKDIIGVLQDVQKLAQAMESYGVQVPGGVSQSLSATITIGKEIKNKGVQLETVLGFVNNAQGLKTKLSEAGVNISPQISLAIDQMLPLVKGLNNAGLGDLEIVAVIGGLGLSSQIFDLQSIIKSLATQIADKVLQAIPEIPNVKFQIKGNEVAVEYHWKPKTKNEYKVGDIFAIKNLNEAKSQVDVSVDSIMTKTIDLKKPPVFDAKASVKEFSLTIAQSIQLNFKKIEFKAGMSSKPDVDVKFQTVPIRLIGSLSFVNSLQNVIKSNQFESGPFIDITENGIVAGYNFPVPNLEVGIFALSNMMLGVKLTLPFSKDPLKFGFNFCTRENPFKLMVSCFGGGGFFMMETTMQGLTRLDAAFEFGAGVSLNVGVASGSVEVMGGVYYTLIIKTVGENQVKTQSFSAYIRMTGRLSIIGLIKVTLEFYLELRYEELGQKTTPEGLTISAGSRLVGSATLSVKVEILFFSKTVKVTVSRTLAGNDADPKFEDTYKLDHWQSYCAAFAS